MAKTVVFTGGGSGGHVMPALVLIKDLRARGVLVEYVGGRQGIEKDLVQKLGIPYHGIRNGKLRRYFSWENFKDMFRLGLGIVEAFGLMLRFPRNVLVFSTGGFVAVPVVVAARLTGKKVFIHEQTARAGLANRVSAFFANRVFVSFEDSIAFFPKGKTAFSGYPLRDGCYDPKVRPVELDGRKLDPAVSERPILFVTGGGNGSGLLNDMVKTHMDWLKSRYLVVHQVGKAFLNEFRPFADKDYVPVDFIGDGMIDIYKMSSVVVSRAGAGTVCELVALGKRSIFVPLKIAQKNEQYHNAMEANRKVGSLVLSEDEVGKTDWRGLLTEFGSAGKVLPAATPVRAKDYLLAQILEALDGK